MSCLISISIRWKGFCVLVVHLETSHFFLFLLLSGGIFAYEHFLGLLSWRCLVVDRVVRLCGRQKWLVKLLDLLHSVACEIIRLILSFVFHFENGLFNGNFAIFQHLKQVFSPCMWLQKGFVSVQFCRLKVRYVWKSDKPVSSCNISKLCHGPFCWRLI